MANQREYNSGYQAAIEEIRKALKNQKNGSQGGSNGAKSSQQSQQLPNGLNFPSGLQPAGQSGSGGGPNSQSQQGQQRQGGGSSRGGGNQGVVRPEDCIGPDDINSVPGEAGGFFDKKTGDQIAQEEGYDKQGGSQDAVDREWKDRALKTAKQLKNQTSKGIGNGPAEFAARLEGIYKPTKDWKKELKAIVGHAITPEEQRRAFANKNTLISQGRIARTDKDQYDSLDYMVAMVDTSGSMSEKDIKACLNEVYGVALAKKPIKLVLIYFGSGVSDLIVFNSLQEFKKEMKSPRVTAGGGTDVAPCFRLLQNDARFKRKAADLVMIFTDGYLSQVKRNPKITKNLCWVIIDNPGFNLQYKDTQTKCVHIKKEDMN